MQYELSKQSRNTLNLHKNISTKANISPKVGYPLLLGRKNMIARSVSAALASMIGILASSQALANDECGTITDTNTVVCEATPTPYTGIRYDSVDGLELVLKEGVVVDGAPVLIEGNGAISLFAEDGTVIRDTGNAAPAVDIFSLTGPVDIRVDEVYGGGYGVVSVSYSDVSVSANYVEAEHGIRAQSLGDGNVTVDANTVWATNGTAVFAWSDTGNVNVNAIVAVAEGESVKGIDAFTQFGTVDVNSDFILVTGDYSSGIEAKTVGGDVSVYANRIDVEGYATKGILANAEEYGNLMVTADRVRVNGEGAMGIYAETNSGAVDVNATFVDVFGSYSYGIAAVSFYDGDVNVNAETVSVAGDYANGIVAATGNGNVNINAWVVGTSGYEGGTAVSAYAFGETGDVNINTGYVSTEGHWAYGMDIGTYGNATVTGNDVITFGEFSTGINISAAGDVYVEMERLATYGMAANALNVGTSGNVELDIERIDVFGDWSQAINASANGEITASIGQITSFGTIPELFAVYIASDVSATLNIENAVISHGGNAISVDAHFGTNNVNILEGAYVYGQNIALRVSSLDGSSVNVAGTVEGGDGYAIIAESDIFGIDPASGQASINIATTGKVLGRVALSGGDDIVVNNGSFLTAGISTFGAGNDLLTNNGLISLSDDRYTEISLQGLETLKNSGVISLVNGRAGDSFTLSGTLEGVNGGQLAVDLDLTSATSDIIQVGKLAGTNMLKLNIVGQGTGLGLQGVTVVNSDSEQNGDELTLAATSLNRGFVGFRVDHDGFNGWTLSSDLNDEAYVAGLLPEAARNVSQSHIGTVSDHLVTTRANDDQSGVWVKLLTEDNDGRITLSHDLSGRDLAWENSLSGVQMGIEASEANWHMGFTFGKSSSRMDQGGSDHTRFNNVNAGLYASYSNDGWFANAMLFGSKMDVTTNWNTIGLNDEGDATAVSFNVELGKRFTMEKVWVEPALNLTWIDVNLPEQDGQYGDIKWKNGVTVASEVSLRMGANNGIFGQTLRPYVDMSIAQIFADDKTVYTINNDVVNVTSDKDMTYGHLTAGMMFANGNFDFTLNVSSRFGDLEGTGASFNGRYRF